MCSGFFPSTSNVGTYLRNKDILAAPQNFTGLFDAQGMVLRLKLELGLGYGQWVSWEG